MVKEIPSATVWKILKTIPDPEIPSISIVDLGIVRDLKYKGSQLQIIITPTYSGCPAISFIKEEIIKRLELEGISNYNIKTSLAPPWTTDWMSDEVKIKLKNSGIAPPSNNIVCPQCDSREVKIISEFGSTACKSLYKCQECMEPFHHFKQI